MIPQTVMKLQKFPKNFAHRRRLAISFESTVTFDARAGTISLVIDPEQTKRTDKDEPFPSSHRSAEARSWMPWIVASAAVALILALLVMVGRKSTPTVDTGTGLAAAAPYASSLIISDLEMSQATSFSGGKVTYIDGKIGNRGTQTLRAITVQVGFRNDLGEYSLRQVLPLTFIRTRDPYVDTEPVSAAPLKPGAVQAFRLIFDNVPADWNQQFPDLRVIATTGQ